MLESIWLKGILGVILGGGFGYALYRFVGCTSGGCPITSNLWSSILYGIVLGLLLFLSK